MDLSVLAPRELEYGLRALRDVVASNGTVTPAERRFLEVVAELHGGGVDVNALGGVALPDVAGAIPGTHQRKRLVQLAVIAAMVEGEVTPAEAAAVQRLAAAPEVSEASLAVLQKIANQHRLLTRLDVSRRI